MTESVDQDFPQEKLLQLALSNLPTGLFICDKDGIVRFINDAYAHYLHILPEQAVGMHITRLIPDSGIPGVLASGEAQWGALRKFQNNGSPVTLLVNRLPIRDEQGHMVGALSLTLVDTPEQIQSLLQQVEILDKKVHSYARRIKSALTANYSIDSIIGNSDAITAYKSYLLRYAQTDSPVLLLGATGTGKELAASALHTSSARCEGPFVSLNCAAIPKELFESEIFGYAPGAFSGAHKDGKIGLIELADEGTLFLDEIGDLPQHAQVKLLRVLEEKSLTRLGSSQPRKVNFRLVAASNCDLQGMIKAGTFREDLYYRINPMTLCLPPLCERTDDIPLLIKDILERMGSTSVVCTESALQALTHYHWPGNIRELRNVMLRALSLCQNQQITLAELPPELHRQALLHKKPEASGRLHTIVQGSESHTICTTLEENAWNIAKSARILGISRATMYEKMKKFGIQRGTL